MTHKGLDTSSYVNLNGSNGFIVSKRQFRFLIAVGSVLLFGAVLTAINIYELHRLTTQHFSKEHERGKLRIITLICLFFS